MLKYADGRRKHHIPQSTGKEVRLHEMDFNLFRGLRRYPCLPTALAARFYGGLLQSFQDRAKWLTHEKSVFLPDNTPVEGPMLVRPWELTAAPPSAEPAWYENSEVASGLVPTKAPAIPQRDDKRHRGMGSSIGATFELDGPEHGFEAVHHEEIFLHDRFPTTPKHVTRPAWNPLQIEYEGRKYEPDALMGLHVAEGHDFYVREHDRGGVPFSRREKEGTSNKEKLDNFLWLFTKVRGLRLYEDAWGLPNLRALFITTSQGRIDTCLKYLEGKPYAERILFKALPQFHRKTWKAPRETIKELFTPWQTVAGYVDITKP